LAGQVNDTAGGAGTVKEALQVDVPQVFETLKITVFVPPQRSGPVPPPLFVTVPPVPLAVATQLLNAEFTAACV
jgi:hypothetical protein